jgi:monothiol glutaredoxin|tara:strand:+ start:413 stop:745 length:333 start_codon:yes stop_codon:yes gene_type:complete
MTDQTTQMIQSTIDENSVVLFMKGSKKMPQCGFSSAVVNALAYLEVDFKDVNVLEDGELRDGIKVFSDWPTIPQLYVKGEFVGGCDIVKEMFESGELSDYLKDKKIPHKN